MSTKIYTVKEIESLPEIDTVLRKFFIRSAHIINAQYGSRYELKYFDIENYLVSGGHLWVCYRRDEPVGFIMGRLSKSLWDNAHTYLFQDLLYGIYPKATYLLLREFIDYGKKEADDILTVLGDRVNIKPSSLKRLGFKKHQTQYILHGDRNE